MPFEVKTLIYCPDHRAHSVNAAGLDGAGLVDAAERKRLSTYVDQLLGPGRQDPNSPAREVRDFFAQVLELMPDVGAATHRYEQAYQRLNGSLTELVNGLTMSPFRLRVQAAAGSGKTLAAIDYFERARSEGRKALLVCFNRPLAEMLKSRLGAPEEVDTFHGFCRRLLEDSGTPFDADRARRDGANYWPEFVDQVAAHVGGEPLYDTLIVDEGQDFESLWWEVLELVMVEGSDVLWLEDGEQGIYQREAVPLDGFVTFRSQANYRTPYRVADFIDQLLPFRIDWRNPLPGLRPVVRTYRYQDEQLELLADRVNALQRIGFGLDQIVVLSVNGRQNSQLSGLTELHGQPLRRFTSRYTEVGEPIDTAGQLRLDSVYRFKGQQAPATILIDVDLDDPEAGSSV